MKFALYDGDFKYLIKMPMDSVTQENVDIIMKEKTTTETELRELKSTTLETMWTKELDNLETKYTLYKIRRETIQNSGKKLAIKKK
jgi:chaperonin cofactor prefoldin